MGRLSTRGTIATFLRGNPTEFTAREVSLALDISYDTCRKHLNSLVSDEREGFTRAIGKEGRIGRPCHTYMFVS